ncbi:MAG TPA: hypothetical protein VMC09_04775 [Anaerolineales bacterium]|nr:hypothetical protein [Anaerolineales bacterium]
MSPFTIVVIFILTALFVLLSLAPILFGSADMDSHDPAPQAKTKAAH